MVRHENKNEDQNNQRIIILLGILLIIIAMAAVYFIYTLIINPEKEMATNNTMVSQSTDMKGQTKTKHKKKKRKPKSVKPANEEVTPGNKASYTKTEEKKGQPINNIDDKTKSKPANEIKSEKKEPDVKTTNEEVVVSKTTETDVTEIKTKKIRQKKSDEQGAILNAMPNRKYSKDSPFAITDQEIITVKETSFEQIKSEAAKNIGRQNPFAKGDVKPTVDELIKSIDNIKNKLATQKTVKPKISQMPEVPKTGTKVVPPDNKSGKDKMPLPPDVTNTVPVDDVASRTNLTGIIGNTAIIDLDGKTKALHAGQNFEGIVVLSVSPRSAVLKINGVKVVKQLRD